MLPGATQVMNEVGVDIFAFCEIAEFYLFDRSDEIPFGDFVELVLKLRGGNTVCVRDLVFLRQFIAEELESLEERLSNLDAGPLQAIGEHACRASEAWGMRTTHSAHSLLSGHSSSVEV